MQKNEHDTGGWFNPIENWTKTPNEYWDRLPDYQSLSEFVVVGYILRHTWGFQEFDSEHGKVITMDEFENGRKKKDGTRLDRGTGLSESAIRNGLKQAEEDNLIVIHVDDSDKGRTKKSYRLSMRGVEFTGRGVNFEPPPPENTPRTEKETKRKKEDIASGKRKRKADLVFNAILWGSYMLKPEDPGIPGGHIGRIKKAVVAAFPDTEEAELVRLLEDAYDYYEKKNPEAKTDPYKRVKDEEKIVRYIFDAQGNQPADAATVKSKPNWTQFHDAFVYLLGGGDGVVRSVGKLNEAVVKVNLRSRLSNDADAAKIRDILSEYEIGELGL